MKLFFPNHLHQSNEQGFVLVISLLMLVTLTLLGIAATRTSMVEVTIAGNEKVQKETFTQADGGSEAGITLLEENFACPTGFTGSIPLRIGAAEVTANLAGSENFWLNNVEPAVPYPSDTVRYVRFPNNDAQPHTNLYFLTGDATANTGWSGNQFGGSSSIGYQASQGGMQNATNIDAQHFGAVSSVAVIRQVWRHIIGLHGSCKY